MLIDTFSAWVAVQIFQLIWLYKLMIESKIKTHTRKSQQVLENYGWQEKKKNFCLSSLINII